MHIGIVLDVNEATFVTPMTQGDFALWWLRIKDEVERCASPYVAVVFSDKGFQVIPVNSPDEFGGAAQLFRNTTDV